MNGGSPSTPAMPAPARVFQSTGLMPAACTFTRTSVGSGSGRGTCSHRKHVGTAEGVLDDGAHRCFGHWFSPWIYRPERP